MHGHEIPSPPSGTELPVYVVISADRRIVVLQGHPNFEELREVVRALLDGRAPRLEAATP